MKKVKFIFSVLFIGATFLACEGEEDSGGSVSGNCDGLESLATTLNQKAQVFNGNPTSGNCSSMKTAAMALLNAARACDGSIAAQYETAAQAWNDVDCSAFN